MGFKSHFQLMAKYNQRMNSQVFEAALGLNHSEIEKDLGAFFGSILGTLNHILVGDILWLSRFKTHSKEYNSLSCIEHYPSPSALNEILRPNINDLHTTRIEIDKIIVQWVSETTENDFEKEFLYTNTKGHEFNKNFGEVVSHLFNHQTHHRGQVSTLLNQLGKDIGVTDYIVDVPG